MTSRMKVRMDDNCPHRFWVSSESDGGKEYCVELGAFQLGINEQGCMVYNGACGLTNEFIHGCSDFYYRCYAKGLKLPENKGKVFRCKHIRAARDFGLDFLVPHLIKADPNMPDELQT